MAWFDKIFGDPNKKVLAELQKTVEKINSLEPEFEKFSDARLRAETDRFRKELKSGKTLEEILPEAFAVVREAAKRTIGQRHFDVQLLGGIALHRGQIAEMKTGEGKTLAAVSPLYLNALSGQGAHLVTVNDYLARIHADWMGRVYDFLGLTVGCVQQQNTSFIFQSGRSAENSGDDQLDVQYLVPASRRQTYHCDVVYGTNNEFGFDYLRDNMAPSLEETVQRNLHYAIVDEVDSILIDEARTPLIISTPDAESTEKYHQFAKLAGRLIPEQDYQIDEKARAATLTEEGIAKVEKILGVDNLYTDRSISDVHHIEQAIRAAALFKIDRDYLVKEGEVVIIDEFTGRMMFGRRYSGGLHQAIEAKENLKVQRESRTLASISFQNYFRLYEKLAGMTGTAATEAEEFSKIYNLEVVVVPTNRPMIRKDFNDRIYKSEAGKYQALVKEVVEYHHRGQPVLIGTISIEKNELVAEQLAQEGIDCQILNAKHHEKEAHIIAQAGKPGAVTVATNMAGRGVDIILGGYPYDQAEHHKVVEAGGLAVLGTERHESRRIDNQLRGRAGRQGDPGMSRFFISLDDDLMRIFGSQRMKSVMETLRVPEDVPIENKMISNSIEQAQKKVEANHFDIRKHLVEYDNVVNRQREAIYGKRRKILAGGDTKKIILEAIEKAIREIVRRETQDDNEANWGLEKIYTEVGTIFPLKPEEKIALEKMEAAAGDNQEDNFARAKIIGYLKKLSVLAYNQLEEKVNQLAADSDLKISPMRQLEKSLLLKIIDTFWMEHLETIDQLRTGIGLRGYGQRDPLAEYKKEGFRLFRQLLEEIDREIVQTVYKLGWSTSLAAQEEPKDSGELNFLAPSKQSSKKSALADGQNQASAGQVGELQNRFQGKKVGRNDPCPCGSGKKYKKCCGA